MITGMPRLASIVACVSLFVAACAPAATAPTAAPAQPAPTSAPAKPAATTAPAKSAEQPASKTTEKPAAKADAKAPAQLPKATQDVLAQAQLQPDILAGLDAELAVPQEWIDAAQQARTLRIMSTHAPEEFEKLVAPFKERYPFLQVQYTEAGGDTREIQTLVAYQQGQVLTDVITDIISVLGQYREANALVDLRELPTYDVIPANAHEPNGHLVLAASHYPCMGYNTNLSQESDLPQTWEDLLTNPRWRNGNIALTNDSHDWALLLWKEWGEQRTKDYLTRFFTELKPQLRTESRTALLGLMAAGEFHMAIPQAENRLSQQRAEGAPLGWHCPEPIPAAGYDVEILRGGGNEAGAKIFVNWLLSKEGQIAQNVAVASPPIHKDLQQERFIPFGNKIAGKKIQFQLPEDLAETHANNLLPFWEDLWLRGGGAGT